MTDTIDDGLLRLFAAMNVLWEPVRDWSVNRQVAAVHKQRDEFRKRGIPYRVGGSAAERMAATRRADALERSGVVQFSRQLGIRSHWRLTKSEYWRLSYWSLLAVDTETALAMSAIQAHAAAGCSYDDSALVPEWALSGHDKFPADPEERKRRALRIEECLTPSLVHGWTESASDGEGAVYYEVTKGGEKWLDSFDATAYTEYDAQLADKTGDAYIVASRDARAALSAVRADSRFVAIPLSCGYTPHTSPLPPLLDADGEFDANWNAEQVQ